MKKRLKIFILSLSCALAFLFGFCFIVPQRSISANAAISKTEYSINNYSWANFFNYRKLLQTTSTSYVLTFGETADGDFVYTCDILSDNLKGVFAIGNVQSLFGDLTISDFYTMSFVLDFDVTGPQFSRIRLMGYNEDISVPIADFAYVAGSNQRVYCVQYVDVNLLRNTVGTYGSVSLAFLNEDGSIAVMSAGTSFTFINPLLTRGADSYEFTPYFYDLDESYFDSLEDSSSDTSSSIDHVHEFNDGVVTKQPTCTSVGVMKYTCVCGVTHSTYLAIVPHSYTNSICNVCGHVDGSHEHVYGNGVVIKEASCSYEGEMRETCECGDSRVVSISRLSHSYTNGICNVCGHVDGSHEHVYSDILITKQPTCTEYGAMTETCVCGDSRITAIHYLGHYFVNGVCEVCGYVYSYSSDGDSSSDSSEEDSSEEDSSEDDSSSNGSAGDYNEGYEDGYADGFNAGHEGTLSVFGGALVYFDVYKMDVAYTKLGTFMYSGKLNYIQGGVSFSNFVEYVNLNYPSPTYSVGEIRIVLSSALPLSQLDLRANGNSVFFERPVFIYNTKGESMPASFSIDGGLLYYSLTYDKEYYASIFDFNLPIKSILLGKGLSDISLLSDLIIYDGNAGYNQGYSSGYKDGLSDLDVKVDGAFDDGYNIGSIVGYDKGYSDGLKVGYESTSLNDNIKTFVYSIFEAPFQVLESFFSLDFVGFDLSGLLKVILSLLVVAFVVKQVI